MPAKRFGLAGLIPKTFQTISLTNSTAVGFNGTARTAIGESNICDVSVETDDVRYRWDSTAAAPATGVLMQKDMLYRWDGFDGGKATLSSLTFVADGGSTALLSFQFYTLPGD